MTIPFMPSFGISPIGVQATIGFVTGGWVAAYPAFSSASKLTFSTDTTAASGASLNTGKVRHYGGGNSKNGYTFTGNTTGAAAYTNNADKITRATDTSALRASAQLTFTNTVNYAVTCNDESAIAQVFAQSCKIMFHNDTASSASIPLSVSRMSCGATSKSSTAYVCGGADSGQTVVYVTTDRVRYGVDTCSAVASANLSVARQLNRVVDSVSSFYAVGGTATTFTTVYTTTDKVPRATETTSTPAGAALPAAWGGGASLSSRTAGYNLGGASNASVYTTAAYKLTFSTDTMAAVTSANLPTAAYLIPGV